MRQPPIETFTVGRYTVAIYHDDQAENPRNDTENVGKLAFVRNREYDGEETVDRDRLAWLLQSPATTKNGTVDPGAADVDADDADADDNPFDPDIVALPVYMFSHSGISFSTRAFGDPWDSGVVGCIYASEKAAIKKFGFKDRDGVRTALKQEIATLDDYVTGQCYGYAVTLTDVAHRKHQEHQEHVDSCWGFIGELDYVRSEAKSAAEYAQKAYDEKTLAVIKDAANYLGVNLDDDATTGDAAGDTTTAPTARRDGDANV